MTAIVLFETSNHKNVLLDESAAGDVAVQSNQHLIIHDKGGIILDPGGHKIYAKVLSDTMSQLGGGKLEYLLLSHQDPDIVAAVNGWLMTTDAIAYASNLWLRFIPHFGLDRLVIDRLKGVPDQGMKLNLRGLDLLILPAHFLHSPGNFQVYDPVSKILYSGDLGASINDGFDEVKDFDKHLPFMEGFHRRYMASNRSMRAWAKMARQLDIEVIAPQHGCYFRGKPMVERFISWCEQLECGVDLSDGLYVVPR
ncbi:MAG: MBL fold metallo-hydrolase [Myxococcaceae bacterium]